MKPIRLYTVIGEGRILRPRLRRPRVICTAATGPFTELLDINLPVLRAYAKRHRFDLVTVTDDTACGRPAAWGKIPIILRLLASYQVVVWLDADTIIVDPSRNIADELRPGKDLYLVEHYHERGVTANTAVFMLRSGACAKCLPIRAWNRTDYLHHQWWENAAIMELLGYRVDPVPCVHERRTPWRDRTHFLDIAWNSMPFHITSPGPVINHYGGQPLEVRRARMLADRAAIPTTARTPVSRSAAQRVRARSCAHTPGT